VVIGNQQQGLRCNHCGHSQLRVIYTRRRWGERIIRRGECKHCKNSGTWDRHSAPFP
jgi:transcriptional regulator NrdR family protein